MRSVSMIRSCVFSSFTASGLRFRQLAIHTGEVLDSHVIRIGGKTYERDHVTNVSPAVIDKVERQLHRQSGHPVNIIKSRIENYVQSMFRTRGGLSPLFTAIDNLGPVVTVEQNFDSLLVPKDHVSRSRNDNYYVNSKMMLRAHTSAHQRDIIRSGLNAFLLSGDVYRRDEIDSTHYPVFHQMEGVRLFTKDELVALSTDCVSNFEMSECGSQEMDVKQAEHTLEASKLVEVNLKETLLGIVKALFGDVQHRWVATTFPFTHPSLELEIWFNNDWLEVVGCGVMRQGILLDGGVTDRIGWAFGIGLDRLAMALFGIPDVRLLWSSDPRFVFQFRDAADGSDVVVQFKPYSKYPACYKDVTFWIPSDYSENDFYELVRDLCGDLVEEVKQIDVFHHPNTHRTSHCYRINYRSMDRTLTNDEINQLQEKLRQEVQRILRVELR
ncbi:phenylalanine--tRNA ligase, mitochondrial-like [Corticium candelabrum]|uniref:phenylalanine--tRNA ligase, mitochondrial-like n=1 Tax=Corticium candelabrum TaxID=121492 RepID=UPI002E2764FE|nr:phenylalanine--tRNA ligase, mitochondrial-like [Corticium candelabrum]